MRLLQKLIEKDLFMRGGYLKFVIWSVLIIFEEKNCVHNFTQLLVLPFHPKYSVPGSNTVIGVGIESKDIL